MREKKLTQKSILPKNSTQKAEYTALLNTVKLYEDRIKEIEGSTYWKIYLFLTKTKLILTSDSYLKNDKWRFFQRLRFLFSKPGLLLIAKFHKQLFSLMFGKVNNFIGLSKGFEKVNYEQYKEKNFPRESDLEAMASNINNFDIQPHIQIFAIVNQNNFKHVNEFLNTLETQIYSHFFVTFVLDNPSEKMQYTFDKIVRNDFKFSWINNDDLINSKPELLCDYAMFVKINCMLRADCIYQMVNEINANRNADFVYSDNDFIYDFDEKTSTNPYFKPKWSPHTILSRNYIGKMFLISKNIYHSTEMFSMGNIYGLVLNYSSAAKSIQHVSKILYHEYQEDLSSDKIQKDHQSLNDFLLSKYQNGHARLSEASLGCFEPVFDINNPLVSIIIPSKNKSTILDACIHSLVNNSSYKNFEIIIIDNGSEEKSFFSSVANWEFQYPQQIRCYRMDIPFNYSILNNRAAEFANGEYLLFLNNDTQVISENLIEELIKIAQLNDVGAVGPKLLYPNNTIQHAGIVLSLGDTGEHIYSGAHKDTAGYFNNTNCLTNYSAVTGACMMIKKERFEEVGGFDEGLAVDCNDVELCCRLYTAGYHNVYVPWVKMYHYECLTRGNPIISNQSMVRQSEEKKYFINKWGHIIKNDPFYNKNLTRISKKYELKHV
jgi:O-antigen biosynthesis protein